MPVKVKIEHLTKIFGKRIKTALTMVEQGEPKNEILKKPVQLLGFMIQILKSMREKFLLSWVCPVQGNQLCCVCLID